ncbi:MAG: helix-turn-helix transcriptional regulator [Bacilli bacterium]|nr:helix-turn-helix transcriptional regulator [Bacilli bacterium]
MRLKELRKSKGLTQEEAAEICGLSRRGYQNLEMGSYKKGDSKTMQYVLAQLDSLPSLRQRKSALSLTSISRTLEDLFEEDEVEYVYYLKEGSNHLFVLSTEISDRNLYGYEEEMAAILQVEVTFVKLSTLLENKAETTRFFARARRVYPQ